MDQKKSDKKKESKKKKPKTSIGKKILITFLIFILILIGAGAGVAVAVIKSAPEINPDILNNLNQTSILYDKDGKYLEPISGKENRTIVPLDKIPKNLQDAFVSIEDERFYKHDGIDVKRIFGALAHNFATMSKSQGASTITQQLIKNYALTPEKKITRKLQEMYLALQLEKKLSKQQILEAYLNTIYLGGNTYGVESAALHYFGKPVEQLNLAECALIAGLTQNPAKYYPYSKKNKENPADYLNRQHTVLAKMLENGYINQSQYDEAKAYPLTFDNKKLSYTGKYQWFVDPALKQIAADFAKKHGISEDDAMTQLRNGGYNIYLTVDPKVQEATQKIIDNPSYYSGVRMASEYREYSSGENSPKIIQPQAAAVIFDYRSGEMRAVVGGRGEHEIGSLNRAEVKRQPGSSIKPLSVYAPALDTKKITPSTVLDDAPLSKSDAGGWQPKNADGQFMGKITAREALKRSRNLVAARLGMMLGIDTSIDYLQNKFHISTLVTSGASNDKNLPALTLGGMTDGVKATEMAAAYGVFGNEGMYANPIYYTKVLDRNGQVVLEKESEKTRALSPTAAYMTLDMMEDVISGGPGATGAAASLGSMPAAGKTGTTNDSTTVWFCGLTPYYSGAVWVGHDKPSVKLSNLKSTLPAKMWAAIMNEADQGLPVKQFKTPPGFVSVEICTTSGKIPTDYCRAAGAKIKTESFPSGSQPTEICNVHTAQPVEPPKEETPAPEGEDAPNPVDPNKPVVDPSKPADPNKPAGDNKPVHPDKPVVNPNPQKPENAKPTAFNIDIINTLFGVLFWR